ncbi:MAG: polymer-forming cytoskeletal protein [Candidatus Eisenbacteria bacterium]|nr:polymer-forming cytoskeletal protein [Candidatus Eisenbacteria bacterium]
MVCSASDRNVLRSILATLGLLLLFWAVPAIGQEAAGTVPDGDAGADTLLAGEEERGEEMDTVIQFRTRGDRVRVEMENSTADMVRIGRSMVVPEDLIVEGDAVVIGGNLDVYGKVRGDAVVVGGVLTLHPTARITGDAVVTAGSLDKMEGARVQGQQVNVGYGLERLFPWGLHKHSFSPTQRAARVFGKWLAWLVLFFLFTLIFVDLFSRATERIAERVQQDYFRSGLAGVLGIVLTPVAFLVLAISIIGLLLVPVLVVVLMVASIWSMVAVSLVVGRNMGVKIFPSVSHPRWLTMIGFILLGALNLVGKLLVGIGGPLNYLGWSVLIAGNVILALAFLIGFGAVLMSRFGRRGSANGEIDGTPIETDRPVLPEGVVE